MLLWFFSANGYVIEILVTAEMFTWWIERRTRWRLRLAVCVLAMIAVATTMAAFNQPQDALGQIARLVLLDALCFVALTVCRRLDVTQGLFYTAAVVGLQHLAYGGSQIVMGVVHVVTHIRDDAMDLWLYPVSFAALLAAWYWLFSRPMQGHVPQGLADSHVVPLLIGVVLSVDVFSCLFDYFTADAGIGINIYAYMMFILTRTVLCAFLLLMQREIVMREAAQRDGEVLKQLLYQQKSQLAADKQTIDLINVKTHDLKKQLNMLGGRIPAEEIEELRGLVGIYDSSVRTGNEALDVLLANKSLVCEQKHIQFDRMIDGASLKFMKPADIYSLFGNAVDNAIEAAGAVADPSRRYIRMKVRAEAGMLVAHVENPYDGERRFENGLPVTTKDDKRYHGFGVRSMRMIVEQYDGVLSAKAEDGVFTVNILIPVP
ncbi:GHKL domain-containing protein [Bifidobacterium aerophilum]|uniref:GHKL domain-containing protein n=2 Tax=Bifidobacterium aerophilum TaxID=1798155 RepID=A0A6N9Z607_9BIFI|nr:ATP-binding protein [Bifidobacterium aerophilum]NEG90048.1 GHKL domain-containing protein [Bifidobacterium aerophilum]